MTAHDPGSDAELLIALRNLASGLPTAARPIAADDIMAGIKQRDRHLSRSLIIGGSLAAAVAALALASAEDTPGGDVRTFTSRPEVTTSVAADSPGSAPQPEDVGVGALVTSVDEDTISIRLDNRGPSVVLGAWGQLTAVTNTGSAQRYNLRLNGWPEWYQVDAFDGILQAAMGRLEPGETATLIVDVPPELGTGPHVLRIGFSPSSASGSSGGVEARFSL